MQAAGVEDRVRTAAQTIYQALIDAELTAVIGAGPWERSADRTAQRNGSRPRTLTTTAGDLELRIPKLRAGTNFGSLLERRRRVDQALFAVIMEAYLHGVSTRKVDDLVKALGADSGISKSEVSRICADLDEEVGAFRDRSLAEVAYPYVFLDATYCKARVNRRVVSQAVVIATGVTADGVSTTSTVVASAWRLALDSASPSTASRSGVMSALTSERTGPSNRTSTQARCHRPARRVARVCSTAARRRRARRLRRGANGRR
jgi:hypothetical protein